MNKYIQTFINTCEVTCFIKFDTPESIDTVIPCRICGLLSVQNDRVRLVRCNTSHTTEYGFYICHTCQSILYNDIISIGNIS